MRSVLLRRPAPPGAGRGGLERLAAGPARARWSIGFHLAAAGRDRLSRLHLVRDHAARPCRRSSSAASGCRPGQSPVADWLRQAWPAWRCSPWSGGWRDERELKRSNAPIFWALFGAGGMLSALLGPMLVFITGIAVPLGLILPADTMSYPHMLAFAQQLDRQGLHLRGHRAVPVACRAPHLPQPARHRHPCRHRRPD